MARVIQEHLKKPLADKILFGDLNDGGHVKVSLDEKSDELKFEVIKEAVVH